MTNRIERYTRSNKAALVSDTLPESASIASKSSTVHPGSPTASRMTDAGSNYPSEQQFSELPAPHYAANPAQQARLPQYQSTDHMETHARQKAFQNMGGGPARASSMIFNQPGQAAPMPIPAPSQFVTSPTSTFSVGSPGLQRSESIVNLDGSKPGMFPGVVLNRQRRSSLQRPESSASEGGQGWGRRSEVGEPVEEEEEVSPDKTPPGKD